MSIASKGVYFVAAKRTPFGKFGGAFVNKSATDLSVISAISAIKSAGIKSEQIDHVIFGNVLSLTSADGAFMPRHVLLKSGIPLEKPAYSVNRLCGSGFQAIVNGLQSIICGESQIVLAGGAENMSQTPFVVRNVRFGTTLGQKFDFEDALWVGLSDSYCNLPMGMTAEKLGAKYGITRDEVDKFSLRSQQLWKAANESGYFKSEIAPVSLTIKKKQIEMSVDEHPRPNATLDDMQKLPPVFQKNGIVTAGSASGICDGAASVILASEDAVKSNGLKPLARLVGYSVVGVDPSIMGIGPAPAIKNLLNSTGHTLNDIDIVEINEAFGAQTLSCAKDLNLDINKLNVNGGAIAIGHPLGASGARITAHLVHELRRRNGKYAIGSACIGGGQGIALLIEAV